MTDFEKSVFVEADSLFRVRTYLCKLFELTEMAKLMTDEDVKGLKKIYDLMAKDGDGDG